MIWRHAERPRPPGMLQLSGYDRAPIHGMDMPCPPLEGAPRHPPSSASLQLYGIGVAKHQLQRCGPTAAKLRARWGRIVSTENNYVQTPPRQSFRFRPIHLNAPFHPCMPAYFIIANCVAGMWLQLGFGYLFAS